MIKMLLLMFLVTSANPKIEAEAYNLEYVEKFNEKWAPTCYSIILYGIAAWAFGFQWPLISIHPFTQWLGLFGIAFLFWDTIIFIKMKDVVQDSYFTKGLKIAVQIAFFIFVRILIERIAIEIINAIFNKK